MAKTTLIRECSNGKVVKMFTMDKDDMRKFVLGFGNMEDLKNYFSDISEEVENFKLITYERSNGENHYTEEKFFFEEDLEALEKSLYDDLLNDKDFIERLLENCPDLFTGSLKDRIEVSLKNNVPKSIYDRNIRTLKNHLMNGELFKHLEEIDTTVASYIDTKNSKEKRKVKNII